jgi:hypothetical protein
MDALRFDRIVMETEKSTFGMALPSQTFQTTLAKMIISIGVMTDILHLFPIETAILEFTCGMALQPCGLAVSQQTI